MRPIILLNLLDDVGVMGFSSYGSYSHAANIDATGGSGYDATPYFPGYSTVDWFEGGEPITVPEQF